jgi:hypothetical protein
MANGWNLLGETALVTGASSGLGGVVQMRVTREARLTLAERMMAR